MIRVYPDLESLSLAAAELFARRAEAAKKQSGRFSVALSGGQTPRRSYELLALPPFRNKICWECVHIFWGDERCVPPEDPRNNARMARQAFLEKLPIPSGQIHAIQCSQDPGESARRYEAELSSHFSSNLRRFDLIFLGLGEDGHTASLFPGSPLLRERHRWVGAVHAAEEGVHRITLTPLLINRAALVVFLVSGAGKAAVLKEVLEGPRDPMRLPVQMIEPALQGGCRCWLLDEEAASSLKR